MKNKNKILILALTFAVMSCGGSGGSGSGAGTSSATPVASNTNSPATTPTAGNDGTSTVPASVPVSYTDYSNTSIAGSVGQPYQRNFTTTLNGGINNKKAQGSAKNIQWNGDFNYNSQNPHNETVNNYTGKGVKIGVIDSGFDEINHYNSLVLNIKNLERINVGNSYNDSSKFHGYIVTKIIAGINNGLAKNSQIFVAEARKDNGNFSASSTKYNEMFNKGVRIFNNSFGTEVSTLPERTSNANPKYTYSTYSTYLDLVNKGVLFVWAGGNLENSNIPDLESAFPYYDEKLEKGWLNVVGIDVESGTSQNPTLSNLYALSSAGIAANWSVSAIAYKIVDDYDGTKYIYHGSSFAAPYVTSVTALIKEKYPFMNGDLLRQTILSTATDIGDKGVDDVYGWGLLNTSKALNGPSLFDKRLALSDNVEITLDGGSYEFSNYITGDAGLNLNGSGKLTLSKGAGYTGNTTVGNLATLSVANGLSSAVKVKSNGKVEVVNANVASIENEGTVVNAGNSVIEKYIQKENAVLVTDLNGKLKVVDGEIKGNVIVTNNDNEYFTKKGTTKEVVTSNITGDADIISDKELIKTSEKIGNGTVEVSRKDTVEYAISQNADEQQINTAEQIENSLLETDKEYEAGNITNEKLSNASKLQELNSNTLDSLSGQIYASAQALTFEQSETVNRVLSDRISSLDLALESDKKNGVWTNAFTSKGNIEKEGYAKGKTKSNGGIIGIDTKIGENSIAGIAFDYSNANVKFDRHNGESDSELYGVSLYGRSNLGNSYIAGRLGYSIISSKVQREIIVNPATYDIASIKHDDKMFSAYAELGYDFKKGPAKITPYFGISYDNLKREAFNENNIAYGLNADKKNYDMTAGTFGLKTKYSLTPKTTLTAYASYTKGFNSGNLDFNARYNNSNGEFTVKGIDLEKNKFNAGLGAEHKVSQNFSLNLNYDTKISKKEKNNIVSGGFRIEF